MTKLTDHLLALDEDALRGATEHPFLFAAGTETLQTSKLQAWLGQDRLYQLAYVNFIGAMLSRVPIPSKRNREGSLEWRTADLLIDSLTNIREEMHLFESTAKEQGWLDHICAATPDRPTRAYQDLFAGATAQGRPLPVALVVLWATEACYLRAWRYAKRCAERESSGTSDAKQGVMTTTFIPAWTSNDFEAFVRRIGDLVDEYGDQTDGDGLVWRECEVAFRQVLWAEQQFWPEV